MFKLLKSILAGVMLRAVMLVIGAVIAIALKIFESFNRSGYTNRTNHH